MGVSQLILLTQTSLLPHTIANVTQITDGMLQVMEHASKFALKLLNNKTVDQLLQINAGHPQMLLIKQLLMLQWQQLDQLQALVFWYLQQQIHKQLMQDSANVITQQVTTKISKDGQTMEEELSQELLHLLQLLRHVCPLHINLDGTDRMNVGVQELLLITQEHQLQLPLDALQTLQVQLDLLCAMLQMDGMRQCRQQITHGTENAYPHVIWLDKMMMEQEVLQ